ncbi:MAG: hypothetical protein AAF939_00310 [Planctomycetota bacterium]
MNLRSEGSGQSWMMDQLNISAETSSETAPLTIDVQSSLASVQRDDSGQTSIIPAGTLSVTSRFDAGDPSLSFNHAEVLVKSESLPVGFADPIVQRLVGPVESNGTLDGLVELEYVGNANSIQMIAERLNLNQFQLIAPEWIGPDQFRIQNLIANGSIGISPGTVAAKNFQLASDFAKVSAAGEFDLSQWGQVSAGTSLASEPFQMDGEIDLAKVIPMLPETLSLHEDLKVNDGKVTFTATSKIENEIRRFIFNLDAANLNAIRGQKRIGWNKPLRLVGTVIEQGQQIAVENIRLESSFLNVEGGGNSQTASFVADGDLGLLYEQLADFVDMDQMELAGKLNGKFGWQFVESDPSIGPGNRIQGRPIQIGGTLEINQPAIGLDPQSTVWQPGDVIVKFSGVGKSDSERMQLDQGGLQLDLGSETLVAVLAEPITDVRAQTRWTANCEATGRLANWLSHLRNFIDPGEFGADGQLNLNCRTTFDAESVRLTDLNYKVEQFGFDGFGVRMNEPAVEGLTQVIYDLNTGDILLPEITITSSSLAAAGKNLQIRFPSNIQLDGSVAYQGDINRLAQWIDLSPSEDSVFWYGGVAGTVEFVSNEYGIGGKVDAKLTDLVAAQQTVVDPASLVGQAWRAIQVNQVQRQWVELWREPNVTVTGNVSIANDFNAISFQQTAVKAPSLAMTVNGVIADLSETMVSDLTGTWSADWEKLNHLLASYTYNTVQLSGKGEREFLLKGPLFEPATTEEDGNTPWLSPNLRMTTNVAWDAGEVMGLPLGASKIDMDVRQSVAFFETPGIPMAGGTVNLQPRIDFRGQSPIATVEQSRVIDNFELKPEIARGWLRYLNPLVADATSAQGRFTVDVTRLSVPILNTAQLESSGTIHLSEVVIGAGPAAEQLIQYAKQIRSLLKPEANERDLNTWLRMDQQSIPIVVQQGRVYHEKLRFSHKDLVIRTRGSVGLDQTLNMVAEIPIHDDWIAGKDYLAGLKNQSFSIPVRGTVSKPEVDQAALRQISQQLVRQTAGQAINKAVGDKITPKLDQFRGEINDKIGGELNKFQQKLGEKLGGGFLSGENASGAGNANQGLGGQIGNRLENELKKGINDLFKKK